MTQPSSGTPVTTPGESPEDQFETVQTTYAMIPGWVIDASEPTALKVYAHLAHRYANRQRTAWPRQADLAKELGVTVRTVESAVRQLRSFGAIVVRRSRRNDGQLGRNQYWLPMDQPQFPSGGGQLSDQRRKKVSAGDDHPKEISGGPPEGDFGSGNQTQKSNQKNSTALRAPNGQEEDGALPGMPAPRPQPAPEVSSETTGATVVAAYVDAYRERLGSNPPQASIKKIAGTAKRLLTDADPAVLLQAARDLAATDFTSLDVQYTRTLAKQAADKPRSAGPVTEQQVREWINDQWRASNTKAVADRAGLNFYYPERAAGDTTPSDEWHRRARMAWIRENAELALNKIMQRSGS